MTDDCDIKPRDIREFPCEVSRIYMYCEMKAIDILSSLRLLVTPPDRFNDPFEFTPQLEGRHTAEDVKRMLSRDELLIPAWREMVAAGVTHESFEAVKERYLRELEGSEGLVSDAGARFRQIVEEVRSYIVSSFSEDFGLVCYSQVPDDILMWSHYGARHRGFVVEFDLGHSFFQDGNNMAPVEYSSERAFAEMREDELLIDDVLALFRRKSLDWEHERECRQLFQLSECETERTGEAVSYYVPIPPSCISAVILGARCDSANEAAIRGALADGLREVPIRRAALHPSAFRLCIA